MNNWYKQAFDHHIENDYDRNFINSKIHKLDDLRDNLSKVVESVYYDGTKSKEVLNAMLNDKLLSSYDQIKRIISEAEYKALDSPLITSDLCLSAIDMLDPIIYDLKQQRKEYASYSKGNE